MKRKISFIVLLVLMFSLLVSCNSEPGTGSNSHSGSGSYVPPSFYGEIRESLVGNWVCIIDNQLYSMNFKSNGYVDFSDNFADYSSAKWSASDNSIFLEATGPFSPSEYSYYDGTDSDRYLYVTINEDTLSFLNHFDHYTASSGNGTEFTHIYEKQGSESVFTTVVTIDSTAGTLLMKETSDYGDDTWDYREVTWQLDSVGAGDTYNYRICNAMCTYLIGETPYFLTNNGANLTMMIDGYVTFERSN